MLQFVAPLPRTTETHKLTELRDSSVRRRINAASASSELEAAAWNALETLRLRFGTFVPLIICTMYSTCGERRPIRTSWLCGLHAALVPATGLPAPRALLAAEE